MKTERHEIRHRIRFNNHIALEVLLLAEVVLDSAVHKKIKGIVIEGGTIIMAEVEESARCPLTRAIMHDDQVVRNVRYRR